MKVLACAGIFSDESALKGLANVARKTTPDIVLFNGGIIAPGSEAKQRFMGDFFKALADCCPFAAVIPGPHDIPLSTFFHVALNAEETFGHVFVAHATPVENGEIAISGLGGEIGFTEDSSEPVIRYSHSSAEFFLRTLWRSDKPIKILMLSEPPPGPLAADGGNRLVREFVKSYHPNICVVMGAREQRGGDKQDTHSLIVNPGRLVEGSAAVIETQSREVKLLDL